MSRAERYMMGGKGDGAGKRSRITYRGDPTGPDDAQKTLVEETKQRW